MSLETQVAAALSAIGVDIATLRDEGDANATAASNAQSTADSKALINDAGSGLADAWSATKIAAEIAAGAGTTIDDAATALTSTWSSTKIDGDIAAAVAATVDAAPGALDTLNELAAALGDDANFAATVNASLGQRVGVTAQTFTGPEQIQARANIDAASATDVGDTNADFLGTYTTARGVAP